MKCVWKTSEDPGQRCAAANTLRAWIEKHGMPQALYVDWKNVYKRAPTQRE